MLFCYHLYCNYNSPDNVDKKIRMSLNTFIRHAQILSTHFLKVSASGIMFSEVHTNIENSNVELDYSNIENAQQTSLLTYIPHMVTYIMYYTRATTYLIWVPTKCMTYGLLYTLYGYLHNV